MGYYQIATADIDNPRVPRRAACRDCGENRMDWLTWMDDGETVRCASCGQVYEPGGES